MKFTRAVPLVATASCGLGSVENVCQLDDNTPPSTPQLIVPLQHALEAEQSALTFSTSAFADVDPEDLHAVTEYELWMLAGAEPIARVWSADVPPTDTPAPITIADGVFDPGYDQLRTWQRYGVRARHVDSRCAASEWTPFFEFRIDDGSTYFYRTTAVHDFYLTIPPGSWDSIDAEAVPPDCVPYERNYYSGALTFEGETLDGVGIRVKGGCGSARHLDGKAGFKVHLAWDDPNVPGCPDERRLHGLQRFTFNNQVQDRSFLHERLGYRLYQMFDVPTPRVAPVRLFVNDELWGLYLSVETTDRRFLDRWFVSNDGMMYEGTYWCDLIADNVPNSEAESSCLQREFDDDECSSPNPGADPTTYEPARQLVARIASLGDGGFYPEVEAFFDFDSLLSMWAVEAIIGHWDGYVYRIINNYRAYHDPATDRWSIIPTGIDQTFNEATEIWDVAGTLAQRCLGESDCEQAFAARLHEVLSAFEAADLASVAQSIADEIRPLVQEDPRKSFQMQGFDNAVADTIAFIENRPAQIRQQLAARGY